MTEAGAIGSTCKVILQAGPFFVFGEKVNTEFIWPEKDLQHHH
nr:MAG TPA: hypothetical protein [Caudoviricetes sp.]